MPTDRATAGARSEQPIARARNITKAYRTASARVDALRDVSIEVPRGVLAAVVGPSGSGKSTLLRVLSGLDHPTTGEVMTLGTSVHRASASALRRLRRHGIGYVFQRPSDNFAPHLSVDDHMGLAAARRHPVGGVDHRGLLERLGIGDRADHLPSELSGGEQQRAAIAQALVAGAAVVVADEPTAELDEASAAVLIEQIRWLVDAGTTFIVATHDRAVIRKADLIFELQHGRLVAGRTRARPMEGRVAPAAPQWGAPTRVEVRGVTKTYPRGDEVVHALSDVSLAVREGELTGLIGRSGSGKSTLLNVIAGWERQDAGTVVWAADGSDVGASPAWGEVAVLPQRQGLLDELTVRENVEHPLRLAGTVDERRDAVEGLLERLLLAPLEHRYPPETSVGEQQRTALARALVISPLVLLADEPTSHQDERSARVVMDALRLAADEGTACLVATHSDEVLPYLDTVLRMADGRIVSAHS